MKPFRGYTHSGSMASVFATICHCSPQQRAIPKWLRHSLDYPWKFQITTGFVESVLTYQYQISLVRLPGSLRRRQTRLWDLMSTPFRRRTPLFRPSSAHHFWNSQTVVLPTLHLLLLWWLCVFCILPALLDHSMVNPKLALRPQIASDCSLLRLLKH